MNLFDEIFGHDHDHSVDPHHEVIGDHSDDLNHPVDLHDHTDGGGIHPHDDLDIDSHLYGITPAESTGGDAHHPGHDHDHDLKGSHFGADSYEPYDLSAHGHDSLDLDLGHLSGHSNDQAEHPDPADHTTMLGASNGSAVSFHGSTNDDHQYNYEYYAHQAQLHKESADRYARDADSQRDLAERNVDTPDKVHSYMESAQNWASKAQSELQAYQDDINKANTYKD